jgi:hypothetical protein
MDRKARWHSPNGLRRTPVPALLPEPEPEPEQEVAVTFTHDGPLGLRFLANEDADYAVEILAVADDVQQRNPGLGPGLCLTHVSGEDVAGLGYTTVLQLLKRAGRPLHLTFVADGAVKTLSLATQLARSSIDGSFHDASLIGSQARNDLDGSPLVQSRAMPKFEQPAPASHTSVAEAHRSHHLKDARGVSVVFVSTPKRWESTASVGNEPMDDGETLIVRSAIRAMKDMSGVLLALDAQELARLAAS